jgi:hypothetical protein
MYMMCKLYKFSNHSIFIYFALCVFDQIQTLKLIKNLAYVLFKSVTNI